MHRALNHHAVLQAGLQQALGHLDAGVACIASATLLTPVPYSGLRLFWHTLHVWLQPHLHNATGSVMQDCTLFEAATLNHAGPDGATAVLRLCSTVYVLQREWCITARVSLQCC